MSNYGKCKNCKYGDPDGHGWKWYCEYYKTLEDPDEVKDCKMYRSRDTGGGCFLTTACCEYKNLPDDCYELQILRKLRDEYILQQDYGEELIKNYYKEAPLIVDAINKRIDRDVILERVYQKILEIISVIEVGKKDEAIIRYMMLLHDFRDL